MSSRTRPSHPAVRLHVDLDGDLRPHRSAKIEAHLRVEVAADRAPNDLPAVELAVIVAVDVAEANRAAVRHALPAALRALPDGISFAVLGSGPEPVRFHPRDAGTWAVADQDQRRRAAFAVGSLPLHRDGPRPAGYAPWAAEARALLTDRPLSVPHLVLITDGSSAAGETRLHEELDACAGKFTCDVFAVGADWPPDPLLAIAERLHGTAQFVDEGLGRAVTDAIARLRRAGPAQLAIEVTLRPSVRQVSLTERAPRPHRLVGLPEADRPHCWAFPTHQWEQAAATTCSPWSPARTTTRWRRTCSSPWSPSTASTCPSSPAGTCPGSPRRPARRAGAAYAVSTPPPGCAARCARG